MNKSLSFILTFRGIRTVARPILWYGFFAAVILQYVVFGPYRADWRNPLMYAVLFVIIALPIFNRRVSDALLCRPFSGTIEEIKVRHRLQTDAAGARYERSRILVTDHLYIIRTERGKKIRFLVREPNFEYARYFTRGTEVCHRFGARYFDRVVPTGDDALCLVCGTLCRRNQTVCFECRSPLK